jgi:hypothetical protein
VFANLQSEYEEFQAKNEANQGNAWIEDVFAAEQIGEDSTKKVLA